MRSQFGRLFILWNCVSTYGSLSGEFSLCIVISVYPHIQRSLCIIFNVSDQNAPELKLEIGLMKVSWGSSGGREPFWRLKAGSRSSKRSSSTLRGKLEIIVFLKFDSIIAQ